VGGGEKDYAGEIGSGDSGAMRLMMAVVENEGLSVRSRSLPSFAEPEGYLG